MGVAGNLRSRVLQHLVRRDSSIVTGTSAVGLHPDNVTQVRWWHDPSFADRQVLEAAELIAFEVLDPALRSRGTPRGRARKLREDPGFKERMSSLFTSEPAGCLVVPTLVEALDRIAALEARLAALEERIAPQTAGLTP